LISTHSSRILHGNHERKVCTLAGCWKTPICGVPRPPHRLDGVARSRSLFVATPPSSFTPQVSLSWACRRRSLASGHFWAAYENWPFQQTVRA
jgi:hypothetical protein